MTAIAARKMTMLERATSTLMYRSPFFGTILSQVRVQEDPTLWMMATDGVTIFYNRANVEAAPLELVVTILAHEAQHIAFLHVPRMQRMRYDRERWNKATDYVDNLILVDCGFKLVKETLLYSEDYADMDADEAYRKLTAEEEQQGQGQPQPDQGQGGQGSGPPQPGDGPPTRQQKFQGDLQPGPMLSEEQIEEAVTRGQQMVAQAVMVAKLQGTLPGSLQRAVDGLLAPVVPWQQVLAEFVAVLCKSRESWTRRNRRFSHTTLPTRRSKRMGGVCFIGDTSGSIGNAELARMFAEAKDIVETLHPEWFRVVWADAAVAGEQLFDAQDALVWDPKGGGGTDMRVPLKHVEQYEPTVVILATDGYTPWPDVEPDYPLIVLCTTKKEVPIGRVIRV